MKNFPKTTFMFIQHSWKDSLVLTPLHYGRLHDTGLCTFLLYYGLHFIMLQIRTWQNGQLVIHADPVCMSNHAICILRQLSVDYFSAGYFWYGAKTLLLILELYKYNVEAAFSRERENDRQRLMTRWAFIPVHNRNLFCRFSTSLSYN